MFSFGFAQGFAWFMILSKGLDKDFRGFRVYGLRVSGLAQA